MSLLLFGIKWTGKKHSDCPRGTYNLKGDLYKQMKPGSFIQLGRKLATTTQCCEHQMWYTMQRATPVVHTEEMLGPPPNPPLMPTPSHRVHFLWPKLLPSLTQNLNKKQGIYFAAQEWTIQLLPRVYRLHSLDYC